MALTCPNIALTNEEVFQKIEEKRSFLKALKIRRAKLIRHILKHKNLLGRIIKGSKEGKNSRGRSPLENIKEVVRDIEYKTYYKN